jgi:hypothetical protein
MEATSMKLAGFVSTAVLSLTLVGAAPLFAQEQHEEQKEEQKAKPEEKREQPAKAVKQEEKPSAQRQGNTKPEEKTAKPMQHAGNGGGRIPDDKFKAHFGQQHTFRVSQSDYRNHRFAYGGYSFGFVDPWPSNWLYTQNVYVVDINGVYYLCNPAYPGVNLALSFTL